MGHAGERRDSPGTFAAFPEPTRSRSTGGGRRMTGSESVAGTAARLRRESAPCERCGEVIEADVAACPNCRNQPMATLKRGSVVAMLIGAILAMTASSIGPVGWFVPPAGVSLFACGVGTYWTVTERYSPTEYDASEPIDRHPAVDHEPERADHRG